MKHRSFLTIAAAGIAGGLCSVALAQQRQNIDLPATQPSSDFDYTIPHIPLERIEWRGAGYPIIPPDVEELIKRRDAVWHRMSYDALLKAVPDIEAGSEMGRPWVAVARQPDDLIKAEIPAFPGAEGGGMWTTGGRGGRVFVVTSLEDSGPGTFREAAEAGGPRTIVFNVAGIIQLERPIDIRAPYVTIAGQSAPGDGVCIAGHAVRNYTHDVILRHMRFRRGSTDISNRDDSLGGDPIGNAIYDHVSASWGCDESLSIYRQMYSENLADPNARREKLPTVNVTVQWTMINETLNTYTHSFGATWGGLNTAFHHNLFASNRGRNASISSRDFNFVNNVLFNWDHRTLDGGAREINIINNYFKPGPKTQGQMRYRIGRSQGGTWYAAGNVVEGYEDVTADNWAGIQGGERGNARRTEMPEMPHMTIQSAEAAYQSVLANAGATLPKRDPVDTRVVEMVRTGEVTYKDGDGIITDISQVGGYPEYKGTPHVMTMNDGIADDWKTRFDMDLNDPDLHRRDLDGDGYTTLEEYLNGTNPNEKINYKDLKNNVGELKGEN